MVWSKLLLELPGYSEDWIPTGAIPLMICLTEWRVAKRWGLSTTPAHELGKAAFSLYLMLLFQMTVSLTSVLLNLQSGSLELRGGIMLTPFREIRNFWRYGSAREVAINLWGNIGVFIPMGLFPPLLWNCFRKQPWGMLWALAWGVVPSVVIESLQLLTPRVTSVDDVILNTAGALIGYGLFCLLRALGVGRHTLLTRK